MSTIGVDDLIDLIKKVQSEEDGVVYEYDIGYSLGRKSVVEELTKILDNHGVWEED